MLVHHIQELIGKLSVNIGQLASYDRLFLDELNKIISTYTAERNALSLEHIKHLVNIFERRWFFIYAEKTDYTQTSANNNLAWETIAQELAEEINKPFLSILMPTLENICGSSRLRSIQSPRHLCIREDDKSWYDLNPLLNSLKRHPGKLSTVDSRTGVTHAISVKELARIKASDAGIAINSYNNFWSYIIRVDANHWQNNGKLSFELIKLFRNAIDVYVLENKKKNGFPLFKFAFNKLCSKLKDIEFLDVIYFYGINLKINGEKKYIIEVLIDCLNLKTNLIDELLTLKKYFEQKLCHFFDLKNMKVFFDPTNVEINNKIDNYNKEVSKKNRVTTKSVIKLASFLSSVNYVSASPNQTNSFSFMIRRYAPLWQKTGQLPVHLLIALHELLEAYYTDKRNWDNKLNEFLNVISLCPLEDANNFFSMTVVINDASYFILELLIDFITFAEDLPIKIPCIVDWLCQQNPSLIVTNQQLESVYKLRAAGEWFDTSKLNELVMALACSTDAPYKEKIDKLLADITAVKTINRPIKEIVEEFGLIERIKEIYKERFKHILDTKMDFFRQADGDNKSWIILAQYLAGAKLIGSNYYELLIPTLNHSEISLTQESVTNYSLTDYILAKNNSLIFLPHCVEEYERTSFFHAGDEQALSHIEKKRMLHAQEKYKNIYLLAKQLHKEELPADPSLYRSTVLGVKRLVDKSVYSVGWKIKGVYNFDQTMTSFNAYVEFLEFMSDLEPGEQDKLFEQHIYYNNTVLSFTEIMEKIEKYKCIADLGKYFMQLVQDYLPGMKFREDLNKKPCTSHMAEASRKKVVSPYPDEEIKRRLLIITTSVMTYSFQYLKGTGNRINFGDCTNYTTATGLEIFQKLNSIFIETKNNYDNQILEMRRIYREIMESIIQPALNDTSYLTAATRYQDTINWLTALNEDDIFNKQTITFFDAPVLLTILTELNIHKEPIGSPIKNLINDILWTLMQNKSDSFKWVRINIFFSNYLTSQNSDTQQDLLCKLREKAKNINEEETIKNIKYFLENQRETVSLQVINATNASKQNSFFTRIPNDQRSITNFKRSLEELIKKQHQSLNEMITDLKNVNKIMPVKTFNSSLIKQAGLPIQVTISDMHVVL